MVKPYKVRIHATYCDWTSNIGKDAEFETESEAREFAERFAERCGGDMVIVVERHEVVSVVQPKR